MHIGEPSRPKIAFTDFKGGSEVSRLNKICRTVTGTPLTHEALIVGLPRYEKIKTLGWGGNGVAVHYRYFDPRNPIPGRDIVVKLPLESRVDEKLLLEEWMANVSLILASTDQRKANAILESKKVGPLCPSDRSSNYRSSKYPKQQPEASHHREYDRR